jgi:hypothetical protein
MDGVLRVIEAVMATLVVFGVTKTEWFTGLWH